MQYTTSRTISIESVAAQNVAVTFTRSTTNSSVVSPLSAKVNPSNERRAIHEQRHIPAAQIVRAPEPWVEPFREDATGGALITRQSRPGVGVLPWRQGSAWDEGTPKPMRAACQRQPFEPAGHNPAVSRNVLAARPAECPTHLERQRISRDIGRGPDVERGFGGCSSGGSNGWTNAFDSIDVWLFHALEELSRIGGK